MVYSNIMLPFVIQAMGSGSLSNEMLQLVVVAGTVSLTESSLLPRPSSVSYVGPHKDRLWSQASEFYRCGYDIYY